MAVLVESMAPKPFAAVVSFDSPPQRRPRRPLLELIRDENWNRVLRRICKAPEDAMFPSLVNLDGHSSTAYPLHYLCTKKDIPSSLIQTFVDTCPEAVRTPDFLLDSLPIHIACQHGASRDVLDVLVRAYPESLVMPDIEGNLPIHYACSLQSPECAFYLLETCPESSVMTNKKRQTPLHLACSRYSISTELVAALVTINKGACKSPDWQGRMPIHSACMWNANSEVVAKLLSSYPPSVRLQDCHNMTPYGISRKLLHLDHHNPTVKLLRSYRTKNADLIVRGMDMIQYNAENLSDLLRLRAHHQNHKLFFRGANAE